MKSINFIIAVILAFGSGVLVVVAIEAFINYLLRAT